MTNQPEPTIAEDVAASGETYNKLALVIAATVAALLVVWGFAMAAFGFGAFIYVMLALVLIAFVFTLTLTRP